MKKQNVILVLGAVILLGPVAWADVTKDDLKKLLASGVQESVIESYVNANRPVQPLSADDLVELRKAGASDRLLGEVINASAPALPASGSSEAYTTPYVTYPYPYPDYLYNPFFYYPCFSIFPVAYVPFCSPFVSVSFFFTRHHVFFRQHPFFFRQHPFVVNQGFRNSAFVRNQVFVRNQTLVRNQALVQNPAIRSGFVVRNPSVMVHHPMPVRSFGSGTSVPRGGVRHAR